MPKTDQNTNSQNQNQNNKENFSADSDDSDSLFSITKSVSIQSMIDRNNYLIQKRKEKLLQRRKLKLEKKREEEEEKLELMTDIESGESDDELRLPIKRLKPINQQQKQAQQQITKEMELKLEENNQFSLNLAAFQIQRMNRPRPSTNHEIAEYLYELKSNLLNSVIYLAKQLPPNTLDELIDLLDGPDHVAEMTGRKGRVVCNPNKTNETTGASSYVYETRNETDVPVELMNVVQKERFMNGEKLIAIISEAASSGISLQANRRYNNQYRRVHITIELPWSADRAIQQFGRTHRSNQVNAPEYIFLISELAGEKRFASTVAKRLESLGALTHGDRRATESRDLSRFNIDNKYGRAALENVIKSICNLEKPMARIPQNYTGDFMKGRIYVFALEISTLNELFLHSIFLFKDARQALQGVGLITNSYPEKDYNNINKFLNRLLGCPVLLQKAIFTYFSDVLAAIILEAKRTGKWDMGILGMFEEK